MAPQVEKNVPELVGAVLGCLLVIGFFSLLIWGIVVWAS